MLLAAPFITDLCMSGSSIRAHAGVSHKDLTAKMTEQRKNFSS